MPILSLLNTTVPLLQSNDPIEKAIELFRTQSIHAAPVMDEEKLTGIITLVSVYQFLSRPGHYASCPVEWIMQKPPVSIPVDSTISEAAKIMKDNHVFTLPVMEKERIVGLLSVEKLLEAITVD